MPKKTNTYLIVGLVLIVACVAVFVDSKVFAQPSSEKVAGYSPPPLTGLGTSNNIMTTFSEFQKKFIAPATDINSQPLDQEALLFPDNTGTFVQNGGVRTRCNKITSHLRYTGDETEKAIWDTMTPEMKQFYANGCGQ